MKRKLLNGLLALAIALVSAGAFSSCKDTNEDMIAQTESSLRAELENKIATLTTELENLKKTHAEDLAKCKEECKKQLEQVTADIAQAKKDLQDAIDKKADKTTVDALEARVKALEVWRDQVILQLASLDSAIKTAQSGVDSNTDAIARINEILEGLGYGSQGSTGKITVTDPVTGETKEFTLQEVVDYVNGEIYNITLNIENIKTVLQDQITTLENRIKVLENNYVNKADFEEYKGYVAQLTSSLQQQIDAHGRRIDALETNYSNLKNELDGLKPDIKKGVDAYDWAQRNENRIKALENALAEYKTFIANNYPNNDDLAAAINALEIKIQAKIDGLQNEINDLKTQLNNAVSDVTTAINGINDAITNINGSISDINGNIANLQTAVAGVNTRIDGLIAVYNQQIADILTALSGKASQADLDAALLRIAANEQGIEALNTKYNALESRVSAVETQVQSLLGMTDRINQRLNKLITGVLVQATNNPVFGTFNLPLGIQSNILMCYAGESTTKVTFPNNSSAAEYNNTIVLNSADMAILREGANFAQLSFGPGDTMLEDYEGNAGKVFVTINPNTVDFTGVTLSLNDSRDNESGIKLSQVQKSDELLTFGYTRADNGFYEASATLSEDKVADVKLNLEPSLKPAVKNVLSDIKNRNFTAGTLVDLAQAIYKQFDGILPAYAMKAAWTAPDINGIDVNHAVYSQYSLAATAFKPLSFKFLYDVNLPNIPKIPSIADKKFDLSKFKDKINFKFRDVTIDGVTIDPIDIAIDLSSLDLNFDFSGVTITKDENVVINTTVDVKVPKVEIEYNVPGDETSGVKNVTVTEETKTFPVSATSGVTVTINGNDLKPLQDEINSKIQDAIKTQLPDIISQQLSGRINDEIQKVVDKLIGEMNTQLKEMIDQVAADMNNQIKDLIDDIQDEVNNTIGNYIGKVNNYTEKINSVIERLNWYMDHSNNFLQAMMVYKGSDGAYHKLSEDANLPSTANLAGGNAISLLPTTYTGEIAVPVFKKFVGVTNVWKTADKSVSAQNGDATCRQLAKDANDQYLMCTPVIGVTHRVPFKASKSGYTYEIVYSALDYAGVTSTRKYYIAVK
ncbi:MAG: hypothetical protein PUD91_05400 [Bacteroidales bacterium]|nr:hypothetical protein [Bacteroidales bacterium]